MSTDLDPGEIESATGYIRGSAGFPTEPRRVGVILLGVFTLAVLALIAVLAVQAAHRNSRDRALSDRGVPVTVTVTSCRGTASGTGITVNGFTCRGDFVLNSRRYTDVIGGITVLKQRGDIVQGIADPRSPSTLSTEKTVAAARPSWHGYLPSILLGASLTLILALAWMRGWATSPRGRCIGEPRDEPWSTRERVCRRRTD